MQFDAVAVDLPQNVAEIARVEADLHRVAVIARRELFGRGAILGAGDTERDPVLVEPDLDRARLFARDRRHAVDALEQALRIDLEQLVDRKSVGSGKSVSVRLKLGGR